MLAGPTPTPRRRWWRGALIALAIVVCGVAHAEPDRRVVLADPDPALLDAIVTALAPYRLEVIVEASAPATTTEAEARAVTRDARFVVWRRDGDLVVFDRRRGAAEHREGPAGELDPASAVAAALTVKTLMRLSPDEPPRPRDEGLELRVQTQLATRIARGSTTEVGARFAGAVLVRPTGSWGIGLAGDVGTSAGIEGQGFKGTWTDWSALAIASWPIALRDRLELEPHVAAGVAHSSLEGSEGMTDREESETLAAIRVGCALRWRYGVWTVGPTAELGIALGTPTYPRSQGMGEVFGVPGFALTIGGLAAVDLGR